MSLYVSRLFTHSLEKFTLILALAFLLPVLTVLSFLFFPAKASWLHLYQTNLITYILNSFKLIFGVVSLSLCYGVGGAWLTSLCRFPGQTYFKWALVLPLSIPSYIIAYLYTDILDYPGPIQTSLRYFFGHSHNLWEIRSLEGAIFSLSLAFYPYVYLLARASFVQHSGRFLETSRILGASPWSSFWKIGLPLARPAFIAGSSLVLMESFNDFATVEYFAVDTLTSAIHRTWSGYGDWLAAGQIGAVMLIFLSFILIAERKSRQKLRYFQEAGSQTPPPNWELAGIKKWLAFSFCFALVLIGFLIPFVLLVVWSAQLHFSFPDSLQEIAKNTIGLALLSAGLCSLFGLIMVTASPRKKPFFYIVRLSAMGYAIPGSIIALGILLLLSWFNSITGLAALIFAYCVRFFSISFYGIESGLSKIPPYLPKIAQSLGASTYRLLHAIYFPLLKPSLVSSFLLIFIDVLKELPATLLLRPIGLDSLALKIHQFASDEQLAQAALPSLWIIILAIGPILWVSNRLDSMRTRSTS